MHTAAIMLCSAGLRRLPDWKGSRANLECVHTRKISLSCQREIILSVTSGWCIGHPLNSGAKSLAAGMLPPLQSFPCTVVLQLLSQKLAGARVDADGGAKSYVPDT